jgi:hypothetical protein
MMPKNFLPTLLVAAALAIGMIFIATMNVAEAMNNKPIKLWKAKPVMGGAIVGNAIAGQAGGARYGQGWKTPYRGWSVAYRPR